MNDWLNSLPLVWGKVIAIIFFAVVIVWAWFRPRSYILKNSPDTRLWRDLRIWASIFLGIQIIIYIIF